MRANGCRAAERTQQYTNATINFGNEHWERLAPGASKMVALCMRLVLSVQPFRHRKRQKGAAVPEEIAMPKDLCANPQFLGVALLVLPCIRI